MLHTERREELVARVHMESMPEVSFSTQDRMCWKIIYFPPFHCFYDH